MITPPSNLSGVAGKPIVVQAINDGKAVFDGEFQRQPVLLEYNDWFVLRGFNAHSAGPPTSSASVFSVKYSNHCVLQRLVGWDAVADGNNNVFGIHHSEYTLVEDCAGFGMARKIFSNSQAGNYTTFRRCFARWEGNHTDGPKLAYTLAYNSHHAICENCIATWDPLMLKDEYQVTNYQGVPYEGSTYHRTDKTAYRGGALFSDDGQSVPTDAQLLGSIAFIAKDQRYHNELGQFFGVQRNWAGPITFHSQGTTVKDTITVLEPGANQDYYPAYLEGGNASNSSMTNSTLIGGIQDNIVGGDWTFKDNLLSQSGAELVKNGGNILDPSHNNVANAANVMFRYVDGVRTNQPLWPWPMNQRIIDAMTFANRKPIDVTRKVFGLCGGTMPSFATPPAPSPAPSPTPTPTPAPGPADGNVVQTARSWLAAAPSDRAQYEAALRAYGGSIDGVMAELRPRGTQTQTAHVYDQHFTLPEYKDKYADLAFHYYVPKHYTPEKRFGLIIWLIGGGSPEPLADEIWQTKGIIGPGPEGSGLTRSGYARPETDDSDYILVAPLPPRGEMLPVPQHASRWNIPGSKAYLDAVVREMASRYNVDFNRLVITGHSMGGIGAYYHAQAGADLWAAAALNSGHWQIARWDVAPPTYIIHGTNDQTHTQFGYAVAADKILTALGSDHVFWPYDGPHAWTDVAEQGWGKFINGQQGWVQDKIRNPYRTHVRAITPRSTYASDSNYGATWKPDPTPTMFWVTIHGQTGGTIPYDNVGSNYTPEKVDVVGASVDARISGSNTIEVTTTNATEISLWLHPQMANLSQPIHVTLNGTTRQYDCVPSLLTALRSLERGDPDKIYHCEIAIDVASGSVLRAASRNHSAEPQGTVDASSAGRIVSGCSVGQGGEAGSGLLVVLLFVGLLAIDRRRRRIRYLLCCCVLTVACANDEGRPAVGTLGGVCYPNQTCNAALSCVSGYCVSVNKVVVDSGTTYDSGVDSGVVAPIDSGPPPVDLPSLTCPARLVVSRPALGCPSGEVPVGGGVSCYGATVTATYPTASGWQTSCRGSANAVSTVVCSERLPGYQVVKKTGTRSAMADCPAGKRIVAGGCECTANVSLKEHNKAVGDGWYCSCATSSMTTAYAICIDAGCHSQLGFTSVSKLAADEKNDTQQCPASAATLVAGGCNASAGDLIAADVVSDRLVHCVASAASGLLRTTAICAP